MVDRYTFNSAGEESVSDDGGLVSYSAYAELEAQLAELRRQTGYTSRENIENVTGRNLELFSKEPDVYRDPVALYDGPVPPAASQPASETEKELTERLFSLRTSAMNGDEDISAWDDLVCAVFRHFRHIQLPASQPYTVPDGSVPEGYSLVPSTIYLDESAIESICSQCGDGGGNYGDFTRGILWVGDIQDDEGNVTHGLHISSDDYPEEGGITLAKFAAAPQHKGE